MSYLIVAYTLIAFVLSGYGLSVWRLIRRSEAEIRRLDEGKDGLRYRSD